MDSPAGIGYARPQGGGRWPRRPRPSGNIGSGICRPIHGCFPVAAQCEASGSRIARPIAWHGPCPFSGSAPAVFPAHGRRVAPPVSLALSRGSDRAGGSRVAARNRRVAARGDRARDSGGRGQRWILGPALERAASYELAHKAYEQLEGPDHEPGQNTRGTPRLEQRHRARAALTRDALFFAFHRALPPNAQNPRAPILIPRRGAPGNQPLREYRGTSGEPSPKARICSGKSGLYVGEDLLDQLRHRRVNVDAVPDEVGRPGPRVHRHDHLLDQIRRAGPRHVEAEDPLRPFLDEHLG